MSDYADPSPEMQRFLQRQPQYDALELDDGTIERLLDGSVASDDVPPGYRLLVEALEELRGGFSVVESTGEEQAVASMMAELADDGTPPRSPRRSILATRRRLVSVAAASLIGGASLLSGLAAANALPGDAQSIASNMLSKVGVSVPDPNSHAGGHPDGRGRSSEHQQPPTSSPSSSNGKGSDISGLAHTTPSTGVDKGAQISTDASGGTSQAGQHGAAGPNTPPSNSPPPNAPNHGGSGIPAPPSSPTSPPGSNTASTHSDGRNTTGPTNSNHATSHAP